MISNLLTNFLHATLVCKKLGTFNFILMSKKLDKHKYPWKSNPSKTRLTSLSSSSSFCPLNSYKKGNRQRNTCYLCGSQGQKNTTLRKL